MSAMRKNVNNEMSEIMGLRMKVTIPATGAIETKPPIFSNERRETSMHPPVHKGE